MAHQSREPVLLASLAAPHPIRIMLIDDGSIFLRSVLTFLQQVPQVEVVGLAGEGMEVVAQAKFLGAEIVISDLACAGLPELPTIAALHAAFPEIRVIVLTLLDLAPYRQAALEAGATEFVSRMNAGLDLLPAIQRAAAGIEEKIMEKAPPLARSGSDAKPDAWEESQVNRPRMVSSPATPNFPRYRDADRADETGRKRE